MWSAAAGVGNTLNCLKSHGDLKLAFVITKGQLELDVICAKELTGSSNRKPGILLTAQ